MPFWSITSLYLAALARIKLGRGLQDAKQRDMELGPAVGYLRHFEPNYKIAGIFNYQCIFRRDANVM
jgi:hypothetical protein